MRAVFEKGWIRRFFGVNLAAAMLAVPMLTSITPTSTHELPIVVTRTDLVSSYEPEDQSVLTKPREFVVPVDNLKYITQKFSLTHPAYDLNAEVGSAVRAFSTGQVYKVEDGLFGYGRNIIIDHGHGLFSLYAHLNSFAVKSGDLVVAGQKIGEVGLTGHTTGPHLHFEVHDNNRQINPGNFLDL